MGSVISAVVSKEEIKFPFLRVPVTFYTLENGHKIVIANKEGDLVNVSTWVKTGSLNENDEISGISHFLEHLMFKGTPSHPAGDFDKTLEAKGAIVNAATWKDYTFYYVTLPKGHEYSYFYEALDLHADMMLNPTIPEEEVGPVFDFNNPQVAEKRERYVVIEEIRMRHDQPWTKIYNAVNKLMYKDHPYRRDVIGTGDIISSIPRDEIMDYYKKWYTPKNMTTIIVGDVDADKIIDTVREKFAFEERVEPEKLEYPVIVPQSEAQYVENKANVNTGFAIMGFNGPKAANLKETIALDVISLVLGEGKSSRLYQNLIEKLDPPVFNVVGTVQYHFKEGNTFFIQANYNPSEKDRALELIKVELDRILKDSITDEELKKAKKKLKAKFAEESETVSEIGELIGHYMTVCEDISGYIDYLGVLESLSIDDIKLISNKYLALNLMNTSVLLPEGK
ncbi:MAG: pitrilysin family protein [bacterium]